MLSFLQDNVKMFFLFRRKKFDLRMHFGNKQHSSINFLYSVTRMITLKYTNWKKTN